MKKILIILSAILLIVIFSFGIYISINSKEEKAVITSETNLTNEDINHNSNYLEIKENDNIENDNALDIIAKSLWKIKNTNSFRVDTTGKSSSKVLLNVDQNIKNERIVIANTAMLTTISSGVIELANQRYITNEYAYIRESKEILDMNPTFIDSEPKKETLNEYLSDYGWLPFDAVGYVINDQTILDNPTREKIDNLYKISLDLNPKDEYGPYWYRREILYSSYSNTVPKFSKIHLEFYINADYSISKVHFEESYVISRFGLKIPTTTTLIDTYSYDNIKYEDEYINYFNKYI